ncbi:hypothetical protein AOQ84DRAFT_388119 [Glonium stellatum]|uniref:Tachykinin family protein n=1 Tax=Glonium stellatum TaxID=574774 RepID=A0A8E2JU25_9PEZI|nr:hypothetical protein AOQ84DRAFT_388119 [Glonium stellatum]
MPTNTLAFVHHTSSLRAMDVEARKLVRSQAMIDFRRRQREEKKKKGSAAGGRARYTLSGDENVEVGAGNQNSQTGHIDIPLKPTILKFSLNEISNGGYKTLKTSPIALRNHEVEKLDVSGLTELPSEWQDDCGDKVCDDRRSWEFPASPVYVDQLEPHGNFDPPGARVDAKTFYQIVNKVESYAKFLESAWVLLAARQPRTARVKEWFAANIHSQTCLYLTWLISNIHMDAHIDAPINDYPYHQAHVFRNLNDCLNQLNRRAQCDTVGSITVLVLSEIVRGSQRAKLHLDGLEKIISLMGGADFVRPERLQYMAKMVDLIYATYNSYQPKFSDLDMPRLRVSLAPIEEEFYFSSSPLMLREDFEDMHLHNKHLATPDIIQILRDAFYSMELLQKSQSNTVTRATVVNSVHWDILWNMPFFDPQYADKTANLAQAFRFAARIHMRAVALRTPHYDPVNEDDMRILYCTIRFLNISVWKGLPYIYLWILLTAIAASTFAKNERRFFTAELCRCAMSFGLYKQFDDFTQNLRNFVWLRNILKHESSSNRASLSLITDVVVGHGVLV